MSWVKNFYDRAEHRQTRELLHQVLINQIILAKTHLNKDTTSDLKKLISNSEKLIKKSEKFDEI